MNKPFFSIIIPLYKTEPYLYECLQSILDQSYQEYECLIINDGSIGVESNQWDQGLIDNLPKQIMNQLNTIPLDKQADMIVDQLVGTDARFKYYNRTNHGLGPTKNFGLEQSTGQYLIILDSDDYLTTNYLELANQAITNNTDNNILFASALVESNGVRDTFKSANKFLSPYNNLKNLLFSPTWSATPICYFWSLDMIKEYKIQYIFNKKGEDTAFLFDCIIAHYYKYNNISHLDNFHLIPDIHYIYRQFDNQMTKQEGFEIELFEHTTTHMQSILSSLKEIGNIEYILGRLFVLRFNLYRSRLLATNKLKKTLISIFAKIITLTEYIIFIKFQNPTN
jgi:glycosyltransferase involved in cell wall biosynthesis